MKFYKFNSSGNDFVFVLASKNALNGDFSELARQICDRHSGIGSDGFVAIIKGDEKNHIIWRFYNCDGSEAHMCGNASRAAAFFATELGLVDASDTIFLHTLAGIIEAQVRKISKVMPNMQNADFGSTASVSVRLSEPKKLSEPFSEAGYLWYFYDTGVPHLVTFIDDINAADMDLAKDLRAKYNANVNFAQMIDGELFVRTFERGVEAETLACGTGMCACALAYRIHAPIDSGVKTRIRPKSNDEILVYFQGANLYFEGVVNSVFSTEISILNCGKIVGFDISGF